MYELFGEDWYLIKWGLIGVGIGFILGMIANGYRKHRDPQADTYVYLTPGDAFKDRKS